MRARPRKEAAADPRSWQPAACEVTIAFEDRRLHLIQEGSGSQMLSASQVQLAPPRNWQDFENLGHELSRAEWNDPFTQKHGRPGHGQQGVDVYGLATHQGGFVGVQCKCRDIVIATTQPGDPMLQQEARYITEGHQRKP